MPTLSQAVLSEFLCPIKWLQEFDIYRAAAAAANSKVPQSPNLFPQLGHLTGSKASSSSMAPYAKHLEKQVVFSNKLTNGALGKNALNPLIKALCRMAGSRSAPTTALGVVPLWWTATRRACPLSLSSASAGTRASHACTHMHGE